MNRYFRSLFILGAVLASGCAGHQAMMEPMQYSPASISSGKYIAKVDQAVIIEDASMSMVAFGQNKFQSSKNLLGSMNQSLPSDLNIGMGLRSFGHHEKQSPKLTESVYGITRYSRLGQLWGL